VKYVVVALFAVAVAASWVWLAYFSGDRDQSSKARGLTSRDASLFAISENGRWEHTRTAVTGCTAKVGR
jgi:hypothetical protein